MNNLLTDSINWTTYVTNIDELAAEWSSQEIEDEHNITSEDYDSILEYMKTQQSYYSALPLNLIEDIDDRGPLVVTCQYSTWFRSSQKNCSAWVKPRWDPSYYMCYSILLPQQLTEVRAYFSLNMRRCAVRTSISLF